MVRVYALWMTGQKEKAQALFEEQIEGFKREIDLGRVERNDPLYNLAGIYAFLGDKERAYEYIERHRFTSALEYYAKQDPLFTGLWGEEEFLAILEGAKAEKEEIRALIPAENEKDIKLPRNSPPH